MYYSNMAAYKNWEGSVDNLIVQKHDKFDIRWTDRQTNFFIAVSES